MLADGRAIGTALTTICTVLDPALIVIGGEAGGAAGALLSALRGPAR